GNVQTDSNGNTVYDKHMWNIVQIDGNSYHVDVTFDDTAPDMLGHVQHTYLLRSDAAMQQDDVHHTTADWGYYPAETPIACNADTYENAFFRDMIDTAEPMSDGTWIYAKYADYTTIAHASGVKSTICRSDLQGNTAELYTVSAYWLQPKGYIWPMSMVSSQVYGDQLYYHTDDDIYVMPADGSGTPQLLYTLNQEQRAIGLIYGLMIDENGLLTYQVMKSVQFEDTSYQMTQEFYTIQLAQTAPAETTTEPVTTTTAQITSAATTKASVTTTKAPAATTKAPDTTTKAPDTTTTASVTTTTASVTTTKAPAATTKAPVTTTKAPAATTKAPVTTTKAPVTTTKAPAATTAARTETSPAAPATTSAKPAATTEATVTTTAALAETTTVPVVTTTAPVTTVTTAAPLTVTMRGDLTGDQIVDVSDAVLLARFIIGDKVLVSDQGIANADCNGDGKNDASDVIWVIQFIVGLIQ
ncbi:MAG: hypothetical protein IKQ91_04740, partial [Oscillospiraceae bacterium]|nr:hypothetical protein [Oscillospiraceae bacterium]